MNRQYILLLILIFSIFPANSVTVYPEVGFDIAFHPNYLIQWPHSTYPALTISDGNITVEIDSTENRYFALGNRDNNTLHIQQNVGSTIFIDAPAGIYDLLLFENNVVIDVQSKSVRVFEKIPSKLRYVQISDIHLPLFTQDVETTDTITQVFRDIETEDPDFVLLTGDFIEGSATYMVNGSGTPPLYTYEQLMEIALKFIDQWNFPIFIIPGNHDWMKIYPSRNSSINIWRNYMYHDFIQKFDFAGYSFVGFGTSDSGLDDIQYQQVLSALDASTSIFKIIYTHADYNSRIKNNIFRLGFSMMLYGHDHVSEIERKARSLWVKTHNAFEPDKYEPRRGFRIIEMEGPDKVFIDDISYEFDLELMTQLTETIANSTSTSVSTNINAYFPSILLISVTIFYTKKKRS